MENNNCNYNCSNNSSKIECACSCGCVGYGYVPIQELNGIYCAADALMEGTVFPELNLTIDEYGYVCRAIGGCPNGES